MASIPQALAIAHGHHQAGRLHDAERIYRLILEKQPDHPDATRLLGVIALQIGKFEIAIDFLRKVLGMRPDYPEACTELGLALQGLGKLDEAYTAHQQALALKPGFAEAHNNLGLVLHAQGKLEEAVSAYQNALSLKPCFPLALNNLGSAFQTQGKAEEAVAVHQQAIAQDPKYPEAYYNLGLALQAQFKFDEAAAAYERALVLRPQYVEAYNNLGIVRQHQAQYEEAIAAYRKALDVKAHHVEAHNNMGLALQALGRLDEAMFSFDRAIQGKPDYVDALVNRAHCLLLSGDLPRGFTEYEARWQRKDILVPKFSQPLWDGSDLPKGTILLHAEQGLGDTIQFIRYVPFVAQRVKRVLVQCDPAVCRLVESVKGVARVFPRGEPLTDFDAHAPLLSLPRIFGTTLETIPARVPYLTPPPTGLSIKSPKRNCLKVGIAWSGRPEQGSNRNRSCPVTQFLTFQKIPEVALFSLQKGPQAQELMQLEGHLAVEDVSERLPDLAETAFVMSQLDLVITVDTSVAHLAGALGQPVWTLLSFAADWRWLRDRGESPWYPTMRLFRQKSPGVWNTVFADIAQELKKRL